VAPVAIVVIEFSACGLLRVESEFGVGFAALNIASSEREEGKDDQGGTEAGGDPVAGVHRMAAEVG
jgi:hypothetical protein